MRLLSLPPRRALCLAAGAALLLPAALAAQARPARTAPDPLRARIDRLLRATPLVDGHNDLPWAIRTDSARPRDVAGYDLTARTPFQTDIPRLRQGGVGAQFWSVYIPGERRAPAYTTGGHESAGTPGYARVQLEQIDIARRIVAGHPRHLAFATTEAQLRAAHRTGKIASLLGMEGGHAIENSLGALRAYHALGVRYMTLTHNATLDWADAASDTARHGGLSAFGEEVVREMNRLGMLVDLSHVSPGTMSDALNVSEAPVIFSHSSARGVTDHPRNVPDSILTRLKANGGVVMVTFVPSFVSTERMQWDRALQQQAGGWRRAGLSPADQARALEKWRAANPRPTATLADVVAHVEHVRRVAGIDHLGLGGDYDGTDDLPTGLEDVSGYPNLLMALARRGWTDAELRKLAGENVLRAMRRAEQVAARLQRERGPSLMQIAEPGKQWRGSN